MKMMTLSSGGNQAVETIYSAQCVFIEYASG